VTAPVGAKRLERLEPLFSRLAPDPTAVDERTTPRSETIARDADPTGVEFAFLGGEVGFTGLQLCLCLGEFGVGAGGAGTGGGGRVGGGEGGEGSGAGACQGCAQPGRTVGVAGGLGGFDETGDAT